MWVGVGNPHTCVHVYMHGHTCMHICMHTHAYVHTHTCTLNMINMDASMGAAICNFYRCMFSIMHMCTCACLCPPTPTPTRARGPQITKNAIKLEQIEIILFCSKIWNLCTFLHSYRIGLVCRWR